MFIKGGNLPSSNDGQAARWVASAGQQRKADAYAGKRHSIRFAEVMLIEVTRNPERPDTSWGVYMHNVSDGGIAFWSKKEVTVRTPLFVREYTEDNSQGWVKAKITHCTFGLRGYLIGAAFEQPPPKT